VLYRRGLCDSATLMIKLPLLLIDAAETEHSSLQILDSRKRVDVSSRHCRCRQLPVIAFRQASISLRTDISTGTCDEGGVRKTAAKV